MALVEVVMLLGLLAQGRLLSDSEVAARLLSPLDLSYPPLARQARIMGLVRMQVDVDALGLVREVRTLSGHPLLVGSVYSMLKGLRFEPLVEGGKAVGFTYVQEVNFRLEERQPVQRLRPPRKECRWRDEEMERAVACLSGLSEKTTEEYLAWAAIELQRGNAEAALEILAGALPSTERRYLEVAESLGQYEEAREALAKSAYSKVLKTLGKSKKRVEG
jgi:TonB family protein